MDRVERDSLGEVRVPAEAYYGPQTQRAIENFPVSGRHLQPGFIRAQGIIKKAAALANTKLGLLDKKKGEAIAKAAQEVIDGKLNDHFVVDVYQMGAGTSQNMNANEVIANRAIELLGGEKGDYSLVHPNDHVNMAQSTNDTIHIAMNIAALLGVKEKLFPAMEHLQVALKKKAAEFEDVVKIGRTHLQDAVPITLGQEFGGYATAVKKAREKIRVAGEALKELNIGGTAVGTGINAHSGFAELALKEINILTRRDFRRAENYYEMGQNTLAALELSGALRYHAAVLGKIANDLRLLSSGPRAGIGEIALPAVQPGSSIMPGKINPSMAEMLNMVCHQVTGNDATIASATQGAQLELNVNMPVIAYNLLNSVEILANGVEAFTEKCVKGIKAKEEHCRELVELSTALVTALSPRIGYDEATKLAREAFTRGKKVKDLVVEKGILSREEAEELLDPVNLL
ncbi:MAG: aspartate ammonia-lyase [Candidatus Binatia bacterium]